MLAILVAIAVFALMSGPGWILAARQRYPISVHVAAGFCSQIAIVLAAALIGALWPGQIDIRVVLVLAFLAVIAALAVRPVPRLTLPEKPALQTFVVPVLATIVTVWVTWSSIGVDEGGLTVHAWFNADGFKHLGHVRALASFGLPAQDIFSAGTPLAYYWFFYVIPGVGAALHADAPMALIAAGLVQTFAFWVLVHGLLRSAGASENWAAALALIGWLSPSPDGFLALADSQWDATTSMTAVNVESVSGRLLNASTLFRLSFYIPQHQLALAGLVSWGVVAVLPRNQATLPLRRLSLAPLAAAGAISTLFGLACLGAFAITRLLDDRIDLLRRLVGIVAVGVSALAVTLGLGIVDLMGASGLDSPIFASEPAMGTPWFRFIVVIPGVVLALGVTTFGLLGLGFAWRRPDLAETQRVTLALATGMAVAGLGVSFAAALLDNPRMALEIQLRATLLAYLGLTLATAWLLTTQSVRQLLPGLVIAIGTPLLAIGMLTPIHDVVWHNWRNGSWNVEVPADDLVVLTHMAEHVPTDAVVLQYPELPYVSGGRDVWTSVLAGRRVLASDRSTRWGEQVGRLEAVTRYFEGTDPLPEGRYDYVYLSRTLHPDTYERLMDDMATSEGWLQGQCLADACLWQHQ